MQDYMDAIRQEQEENEEIGEGEGLGELGTGMGENFTLPQNITVPQLEEEEEEEDDIAFKDVAMDGADPQP